MAPRTARPIKFKVDITVKFRSKTYTWPKDHEVTVTKSGMEIDVSLKWSSCSPMCGTWLRQFGK